MNTQWVIKDVCLAVDIDYDNIDDAMKARIEHVVSMVYRYGYETAQETIKRDLIPKLMDRTEIIKNRKALMEFGVYKYDNPTPDAVSALYEYIEVLEKELK